MLSEEHRKILKAKIIDYTGGAGSPYGAVQLLVGDEWYAKAPGGASIDALSEFVVNICMLKVKVFARVLEVLDTGKIDPDLEGLRDVLKEPIQDPEQGESFELLELGHDEPFIDRKRIRQALRKLISEDGAPILVINGNAGMGKTYTMRLIKSEADRSSKFRVVAFEAKPDTAPMYDALYLASSIVNRIVGSHRPAPRHPVAGERRVKLLMEWIADELSLALNHVWLVLDGFDQQSVQEETAIFIDRLLSATANDARFKMFRLVLLDFSHDRVEEQAGDYNREILIDPEEKEIAEFFQERFPGWRTYESATAAAIVLQNLPNTSARMEKLRMNVVRVCNEIGP